MSKYKNGVKIVRFPGGRIARFHKPGTKAAAKGAAKKRAAGRMLAKKFGFAKRSRSRRRNPFRAETYVRKYKHDMLRAARYLKPARHGRGGRKLHPKSRRLRERRAKVLRETKMLKRHFRINPDNIRTGRPRAVRAPDFIYHSRTPASLRNKWVVIGTDYGYLHNSGGEIRTWDTRSGAAAAAKKYASLSGIPTIIGSNPRVSKTKIVYVVQGNYGYHGWEDENEEDNKVDARRSLKEYRENGPGSYRLIRRRVKIEGNPGNSMDWQSSAQTWLQKMANSHYSSWFTTAAGKRYLKRKLPRPSPHHCGYSQPEWMDAARAALGKNDEEEFKSIRGGVLVVGHQYLSNPRGHRGSRKKSRSPARRLLNRKREFGFQEATANRWARAMDETDANRVFLRAMKKSKVTKRYKRSRSMKNPRRNPQEAFNVYRKGRLIDTVFATGYTADEMKRSLINHDGYPSDIRVTKRKAKR